MAFDDQFTDDEVRRIRQLLEHVSFPDPEAREAPVSTDGRGGSVDIVPGLAGQDGALAGRIRMHNPGGTVQSSMCFWGRIPRGRTWATRGRGRSTWRWGAATGALGR